jgi:hypothetical protein
MKRRKLIAIDTLETRRMMATFTVTNANDAGAGSLRAAITGANGTAASDVIHFNVPGNPAQVVINLATALPDITTPLTIDGSTQSGYVPGAPIIKIRGTFLADANGLNFTSTASNSTVKGIAMSSFKNAVASDLTKGNAVVAGGARFVLNESDIGESSGNDSSGVRIIAGGAEVRASKFTNNLAGVFITGTGADDTEIISSSFSSNVTGADGVVVSTGADDTLIGNGTAAGVNTFRSHTGAGVLVEGTGSLPQGTVIAGNEFGFSSNTNLPNTIGIQLTAGANTRIGGTTPGQANFFASSTDAHIDITGATNTTGTRIIGNWVGYKSDNSIITTANTPRGIYVADNTIVEIGGPLPGERNFITGGNANTSPTGISVREGANATIRNNLFGYNPVVGFAQGKLGSGVAVAGGSVIHVGGTGPNDGNFFANYSGSGVVVGGDSTGHIYGNHFGFTPDGSAPAAGDQGTAISVLGNAFANIGGALPGQRNYITGASNTFSAGVEVSFQGDANIRNNYFGFNAAGTRVGTMNLAVYIAPDADPFNVIGGLNANEGNFIAGVNTGVLLARSAKVHGNQIGLNIAGTSIVFGMTHGIDAGLVSSAEIINNVITTSNTAINVGNSCTVRGNRLATSADGLTILNTTILTTGIAVRGGNNTIGGSNPGEGNTIGQTKSSGRAILIDDTLANAAPNLVRGNNIFTNVLGVPAPAGSGANGIEVQRDNLTIGGTAPGAGNLICNADAAIVGVASSVAILGNTFGKPDNTAANGIAIYGNFSNSSIGTADIGSANLIFGGNKGVVLLNGSNNVSIRRTHYFGTGIAIDLNNDGITPNDINDADTGPNGLQNFPTLVSVNNTSGSNTQVVGVLNTTPSTPVTIDFFSGATPNSNTTLLGSINVLTDLSGAAPFNLNLPFVPGGQYITATATNNLASPLGNTSELSPGIQIPDTTAPTATIDFEYETRQAVNIAFSENVAPSLVGADLVLTNTTTNTAHPATSMTYNAQSNTATFLFNNALPDGNYTATLPTAAVTDSSGNPNAATATSFHVMAGDADRNRVVNFADLVELARNFNKSPRTFSQGDFNYSGNVDFADLVLLARNFNKSLPSPFYSGNGAISSGNKELLA